MSDELLPIPRIPDGLREAAQLGKLIPFIGAGVSRLAGCPGWADFADGALKQLIEKGKFSYSQFDQIKHLNPRVKLSLARTLEAGNGVSIDFGVLLNPREPIKGSRLYNSLFKLGKTFVTTNYDEWLDKRIAMPTPAVVPQAGPANLSSLDPMRVIHRREDLLFAALSEPNTVIHLHGSLLDPKGMILTTQDYVRHYANDRLSGDPSKENRVLTFLEDLFKYRTVLFIGYGLEELEILEYVIVKARLETTDNAPPPPAKPGQEEKHYIIQGFFSHEEQLRRTLKSYYRDCGIGLLPYLRDQNDWDQLLEVLEEFAQQMPASDAPVLQKAQDMAALLNG